MKFNDQRINTFDEKIDLFKNLFFLAFFSIDLSDRKSSFYSNAVECSMIIIEREMYTIINRVSFDKISSSNEIINRLIKTCSNTLTKLLTSLFQICVMHVYHSIVFKTANIITLKKKI